MDPSLTVAQELERVAAAAGGGNSGAPSGKKNGAGGGGASGRAEDPHSFDNQRRRILQGALSGTAAAAAASAGSGRHISVLADEAGGVDDDDGYGDEGFAMPSVIPSYAEGFGASAGGIRAVVAAAAAEQSGAQKGAAARKRGGAAAVAVKSAEGTSAAGGEGISAPLAAARAYEAHQRLLASAPAPLRSAGTLSAAAARKRDREAFIAEYEDIALPESIRRCARCRRGLLSGSSSNGGAIGAADGSVPSFGEAANPLLSAESAADLAALYAQEARRFASSPTFLSARVADVGAVAAAPKPQLWCPSCVAHAPPVPRCPLCPPAGSAAATGGTTRKVSNDVPSPLDLASSEVFGYRFGGGSSPAPAAIAAEPMLRCLRCREAFHGRCLGMPDALVAGLAALSEANRYCCPNCSMACAVPEGSAAAGSSGKRR